jgi:membrane associated rhomboid family serine protease
MKFLSVEWKRPSGGRVVLVLVVLALLSWMAVASMGKGVGGWAAVGALAGGAICSACGVDSTKGWRELSVAAGLSSVLAVAMVMLHRAMA